ncbi:MAG: hypothetical protein KJT03_03680, partial [Verrucomicrobiae bacterium]|nr:hypothetical protein [Verrucomicrobiae bacterium]
HFEARSDTSYLSPGDDVNLEVELTLRAPVQVRATRMEATLFDSNRWPKDISLKNTGNLDTALKENSPSITSLRFPLPEEAPVTQPFWLREEPGTGIYHFKNTRLLELMSIPPPMAITANLEVEGYPIQLTTPAIEVVSDPVKGEVHHQVNIRPKLVLEPDAGVLLFEDNRAKPVKVSITANTAAISGKLVADAPKGWSVDIAEPQVALAEAGSVAERTVLITPPGKAAEGSIFFKVISTSGNTYDQRSNLIDYEHVGRLALLAKAETKLTRLDLHRAGNHIACVEGVGDPVPETLMRIGYTIDRIQVEDIDHERLKQYDSVILGPRVFDALTGLDKKFDELLAYVEAGGTLVCQYNTTASRTKSEFRTPYPLRLSRDRVSEENAEMRILKPDNPVFNRPNKIVPSDFENWIQERGLYFADSWDEHYEAVISANDRGEPPRDGGLLIAPYGKGWYVYTGLSFFRQLPEGNPGAIKLFVNLISLGHGN